jgi:glycosyltransferase involved in cell wall biosynthesis
VVISLLRGLDPDRFDAHLVCLDGPGRLFADLGLAPERCLVLQRRLTGLGSLRFDPGALRAIRAFLGERSIELVHAHNLAPLVYAGLPARSRRPRPRVVYSEHNQIYSASPRTRSRFAYYVRLADHVVAVSRDLRTTLQEQVGVRRPVTVIHNGIDGERFRRVDPARVRHELGIGSDEFLVGTGVVLSEQKGIRFLLQAAATVVARQPRVRFVVAGDGPLRGELEAELRASGLGDRFRLLGYRSDIPAIISALDLYVLPSLWEGLPLALLEALAIGTPIVCTRVGGNPEIVVDGENGYLVEPRDAPGLAARILAVAADPAFVVATQERNRARFEREFSEPAMVGAHQTLYDSLLEPHGGA